MTRGLGIVFLVAVAAGWVFLFWRLGAAIVGWFDSGIWTAEPISAWINWMTGDTVSGLISNLESAGVRKVAFWVVGLPAWVLVPLIWWGLVFLIPWPSLLGIDRDTPEKG